MDRVDPHLSVASQRLRLGARQSRAAWGVRVPLLDWSIRLRPPSERPRIFPLVLGTFALAVAYAVSRVKGGDRGVAALLGMLGVSAAVGIAFESGENNRFQYEIFPRCLGSSGRGRGAGVIRLVRRSA